MSKWLVSFLVFLGLNSVVAHTLPQRTQQSDTLGASSTDHQAQSSSIPKVDGGGH